MRVKANKRKNKIGLTRRQVLQATLLAAVPYAFNSCSGGFNSSGATSSNSESVKFNAQPGFSASGTVADGGTFTIASSSGVFGPKPYGAAPLVWAPFDTNVNGSPLGRISGSSIWNAPNGGLEYVSGGGPTGLGRLSGINNPSPGGMNIGEVMWTLGLDLDQWSGWSAQNNGTGYFINDLSQQTYLYRQVRRVGMGYLPQSSNYNTKTLRIWARTGGPGSPEAYPDMYIPPCNGRFNVEFHNPVDWTPTPDYNISATAIATIENFNNSNPNGWLAEEVALVSNSTCTSAGGSSSQSAYPDANVMWWAEGIAGDGSTLNSPLVQFPNYPNVDVQPNWWNAWKFLQQQSASGADYQTFAATGSTPRGTMIRIYPCHYIVDATAGGRLAPAAGAYIEYAMVYLDDSWCRVHLRNNATRSLYTLTEIQIPSAWNSTSISATLRLGRFSSFSGLSLIVTDSTGAEYYVGDFV